MRHTLFISDLHLCESRPKVTQLFIDWLGAISRYTCDGLYILGDFFEYWAGDDAISEVFHGPIIAALKRLTSDGVAVYVMHGNRDFLLGQQFLAITGVKLLTDPTLTTLYGQRMLLTHGDALCTDDVAYMQFRQQVRQDAWQQSFLAHPVEQRLAFVQAARSKSESEKVTKAMAIMDVNEEAVNALLHVFQYPPYLIHGHTHRPNRHEHRNATHTTQRWVLGDWYEHGNALMLSADGQWATIPIV